MWRYILPNPDKPEKFILLSCGKYRAFLELQLLDPDITPEAVQNMTMREIRELINSLSVNSGTDTSSYRNQGHGHHGHGGGRGNR